MLLSVTVIYTQEQMHTDYGQRKYWTRRSGADEETHVAY